MLYVYDELVALVCDNRDLRLNHRFSCDAEMTLCAAHQCRTSWFLARLSVCGVGRVLEVKGQRRTNDVGVDL